MLEYIKTIFAFSFVLNAVLGALLASIACGITGTYVVKKRLTFVSGGIAHAIMGGIGIAYYLKANILVGAIIFAVIFTIILSLAKIKVFQNEDTIVGALWAVGMSIGIIFIYITPGYNVDLISFIFGNILMIEQKDLIMIFLLDVIIIFSVFIFYYHFLYVSFDEDYLRVRGLMVVLIYFMLLLLISITVVVLIRIVGLILVIALLTLPAAISSQFTRRLGFMMLFSVFLGIIFTFFGIFFAYILDLPASACIIILAAVFYLISLLINFILNNKFLKILRRNNLEKKVNK